jgi:phosphoglycolate phosphatase
MAIKGVLFDKDGTLIDSDGTWVPFYKNVLKRELGLSEPDIEAKMVAAGYDPETDGFIAGSMLAGGTARQLVEVWWPHENSQGHDTITRRLQEESVPLTMHYLRPLFDLTPVLSALKNLGMHLGIATNDGELSAKTHMNGLSVGHFFSVILGADSVKTPKPSGQMVKLFAERAGLMPDQVAMVGDNRHDMEEARNGGAGLAIGVLTGNSTREDLAPFANHVLDSVEELPHMLRKLELVGAI